VPYDTTQPYRHGQDTPGRSVPASPDRPNSFLPSAYNDPDPPPAANFFAEEGQQQQSLATNQGVEGRDMLGGNTPTLNSHEGTLGMSTPAMGAQTPLPKADQTPKQSHAQARGF